MNNFNDNSDNKCQKNLLSDKKINNGPVLNIDVPTSASVANVDKKPFSVGSITATFREPRCLYVNIAVLCVSLALFFTVFFGFVPYTVKHHSMAQELNLTKQAMVQCGAVHDQMQNIAHQLDIQLAQCAKDLDSEKFLLSKSLQELEATKSAYSHMDQRLTQLKDHIADLNVQLKIKDENLKLWEQNLQEKSAQSSHPAEPWYWPFAQNNASFNRPTLALFIPFLCFFTSFFLSDIVYGKRVL